MARCADSIGMINCTNCIGSDRSRSIAGQHPAAVILFLGDDQAAPLPVSKPNATGGEWRGLQIARMRVAF